MDPNKKNKALFETDENNIQALLQTASTKEASKQEFSSKTVIACGPSHALAIGKFAIILATNYYIRIGRISLWMGK